jgi:hypothetical protein
MSMTYTKKTVSLKELKVDLSKNVRLSGSILVAGVKVDTYELPSMIDAIVAKRGIVTPIVVNKELSVLQGFRRSLAGLAILSDPERYLPDPGVRKEVIDALNKVPVLVYDKLTPSEELGLVNDHGDRKGIGRTELVRTVWNLYVSGYSEAEICVQMLYAIAEYTGNTRKLNELPDHGTPARNERIKKWLHGTVGNFMLAAYNMGPRIREAVLRSHMIDDGLIKRVDNVSPESPFAEKYPADQRPEFYLSRDRMTKLSASVTTDKKAGQWDSDKFTGPEFEKVIAGFIEEDTKPKGPRGSDSRLSATDLQNRGNTSLSSAFRAAYNIAAGKPVQGAPELDQAAARFEAIANLVAKHIDNITDVLAKDILSRVLFADPDQFEQFLLELCVKPENAPAAEMVQDTAQVS